MYIGTIAISEARLFYIHDPYRTQRVKKNINKMFAG